MKDLSLLILMQYIIFFYYYSMVVLVVIQGLCLCTYNRATQGYQVRLDP